MFNNIKKRVEIIENKFNDLMTTSNKISYNKIDFCVICDRCGGIFLDYMCKYEAVMEKSRAVRRNYCINCWEKK